MTKGVADRDPVEELAEDFMARLRRGERPAVSEYAAAHPELADEIRELFPALLVLEQVKPPRGEPHTVGGATGPPEVLGDYRILREVARGGMGVVYEAEQVSLGRHVALKVLPVQPVTDPVKLLRFRREARSAARLHHTNIVPVFEVGSTNGVHYYTMQFIRGQGLDEVLQELRRLRSGERPTDARVPDLSASLVDGLRTGQFQAAPVVPVPRTPTPCPRSETSTILMEPVAHYFRSIARLGVQAADALAYAHGQRVLHRDVKPSNLLLDRQGTLWLTDFGLAKDDTEELTRTGDVVGTVRYMAPERFQGVSDPRTDVYALGVTLYELLTFRPAFPEADRVRLIQQIMTADPPRPRTIDPTLPRDLETIVLKAVEKDPARRYPTAAEMAEDLRQYLADRPIRARRASWREQAWRWCRRNPVIAGSLSAAFAALALLAGVLAVGGYQVWRAKRDVEAAKGQVERTLAEERESLYAQRVALADRELGANGIARAEELLAGCPQELRRWEWHYLDRNRGRLPKALTAPRAVTGRGALSPDGRRAAVGGMDGTVFLWDLATGARAEIAAHLAPCQVAFGPGSRILATADEPITGDATVKLWDVGTGQMLHLWRYPHGGVEAVAFGPDADVPRLAIAGSRRGARSVRVDVWDAATGHPLAVVEGGHVGVTHGLAFSPDGRLVASASSDGTVRVSDSRTGEAVHEFRHDTRAGYLFWCLAFSPDGRRVAAGYGDEVSSNGGGILIWDVADGALCGALSGHMTMGLAFGPAGRLASGGGDGTVRVWDPDRRHELLSLRGHTNAARCLGFTPDGHQLVTVGEDRVLRVWDATPVREGEQLGDERLTLRGHTDGVFTATFLPGGGGLVTAAADGTVRRWSLRPDAGPPDVVVRGGAPVVAVAPGSGLLAVADGRSCRLVDAWSGETRRLLDLGPDDAVAQLAFSPDGRLLAGREAGRAVFVWDVGSGKVRRLDGHTQWVYGVAFRPGRRPLLASVSTSGEVIVWDPLTGRELARHRHDAACAVAFSPDGRRLATAGWDRAVRVWDAADDDPARWCVGPTYHDPTGGPNAVVFGPDSELLAWGGTDSAVKVWRPGGGEAVTLRGHRNWVWDVAFTPDGSGIASASRDGTVKLWANPFAKR